MKTSSVAVTPITIRNGFGRLGSDNIIWARREARLNLNKMITGIQLFATHRPIQAEITMPSQNFSPLNARWPKLYEHAAKAEEYVSSDPHAAIVKLRCYAELMVEAIYEKLSLSFIGSDSFYERLSYEGFRRSVPSDVMTKLQAIRVWGNKAAHGEIDLGDKARILLKDAYLLGKWFYRTIENDDCPYPDFSMPSRDTSENENNSEIKRLTNELEQALSELSQLQSERKQSMNATSTNHDEEMTQEFTRRGLEAASKIDMEPEETAKLLHLNDAFSEYELSPGQTALVGKLEEFLGSKTENVFLLQGYAGTGKTFITKGLTEYFRMTGRNYILSAPTGKAAKVISTKANSPAYTIHKTIYSFRDIKEYTQDVDGTETFKFYADLAVNTNSADTVYIVDEASMVSDKYHEAEFIRYGSGFLLKDFLKFVNLDHNDHRKKIIFIGDNAQLPPVGMNFSPALSEEYLQKNYNLNVVSYKLTDVVRQKGDSGIIKNAGMLRKSIDEKCFNTLVMDSGLPDVNEIQYQDIIERYFSACEGKINNNAVLIAYSNADVTAYNFAIRKRLLPGCGEEIYPGDKIMANNNNTFYGFFISNGDFGIVRNVLGKSEIRNVTIKRKNVKTGIVENIPISLRFRNVELGFRDENNCSRFFEAKILENVLYSDQLDLSSDENKALYVDFCIRNSHIKRGTQEFKDSLKADPYFNAMRVKFGYAITCHKAQGSEWKNVFVKCRNNNTGLTESYFRWLYTAVTRSSKNLYLIDPPEYKLTTGLKTIGFPGPKPTAPAKSEDTILHGKQDKPTISVTSSTAPAAGNEISGEQFGLTDDYPFLQAILHKVRELIAGTGIEITAITHYDYQEAYFFKENSDTTRINIWYRATETIRSVVAQKDSPLARKLLSILTAPLKSFSYVKPEPVKDIDFPYDFLQDFYKEVVERVSKQGIRIQNVEFHQYSQRYTFVREKEVATLDIFYNSKKQFTKIAPFKSSPATLKFEQEIANLL